MTGLILLVLIGILVAYGYTRLRGRMKLTTRVRDWVAPIVIVVLVGLLVWAAHTGSGSH